jgi:hypothetical protein
MSGFNPNNRFINPTDDLNNAGGEGTINVNVVSNMNEMANKTSERLFQAVVENPQSSELVVSSRSRTRGTPYDFTTDIGGPLYRGRTARLTGAVVPGLPNINRSNNQVRMQTVYSDVNNVNNNVGIPLNIVFNIPYGYYSPSRFEDVFAAEIANQFASLVGSQIITGGGDDWFLIAFDGLTVTVTMDIETFRPTITISATSTTIDFVPFNTGNTAIVGGFRMAFWFDETCSFITRGVHMVPFLGTTLVTENLPFNVFPPNSSIESVGATPYQSLLGMPASFYYSRFITVISENLSLYTFGESRVDRASGGGGSGKIIGVFATARYNGNASMGPFAGVDVLKGVEAPTLGIRNAQLKLNELVDFSFQDEYGILLDDIFSLDNVSGPTLTFSITY